METLSCITALEILQETLWEILISMFASALSRHAQGGSRSPFDYTPLVGMTSSGNMTLLMK